MPATMALSALLVATSAKGKPLRVEQAKSRHGKAIDSFDVTISDTALGTGVVLEASDVEAEESDTPDQQFTQTCDDVLKLLREHHNIWSKVSCPERLSVTGPPALHGERDAYRDVVPFARRVIEEFPDRVLWGTDWPHPNLKDHMPDDGLLVDFIPQIAVTAELQRKLLVDNPMRLYWPEEQ